jgi:hypothetical protein
MTSPVYSCAVTAPKSHDKDPHRSKSLTSPINGDSLCAKRGTKRYVSLLFSLLASTSQPFTFTKMTTVTRNDSKQECTLHMSVAWEEFERATPKNKWRKSRIHRSRTEWPVSVLGLVVYKTYQAQVDVAVSCLASKATHTEPMFWTSSRLFCTRSVSTTKDILKYRMDCPKYTGRAHMLLSPPPALWSIHSTSSVYKPLNTASTSSLLHQTSLCYKFPKSQHGRSMSVLPKLTYTICMFSNDLKQQQKNEWLHAVDLRQTWPLLVGYFRS